MSETKYIEKFWKDATPQDAAKEPPMVARFRDESCQDWFIDKLVGLDRSRGIWISEDSTTATTWIECQVYNDPWDGIKIQSLEELEKEAKKINAEYSKKVRIEKKCVLLDGKYWIELNRINTELDLLEWVVHLSEKVWVDSIMLQRFIKLVCENKQWNLYR